MRDGAVRLSVRESVSGKERRTADRNDAHARMDRLLRHTPTNASAKMFLRAHSVRFCVWRAYGVWRVACGVYCACVRAREK